MARPLTVRVDDALRTAAQTRADADGFPSLSALIVTLLADYTAGTATPAPPAAGPPDPRRDQLVRLVRDDGLTLAAACREVDVVYITGRRWLDAAGYGDLGRAARDER